MRSIVLAALLLAAQSHAADRVRVLIQADNPEQAARIQSECEWLRAMAPSARSASNPPISKIEGEGRKAGANHGYRAPLVQNRSRSQLLRLQVIERMKFTRMRRLIPI